MQPSAEHWEREGSEVEAEEKEPELRKQGQNLERMKRW